MFLEGKALFDLSQLLAYRKGNFDPRPSLEKVILIPFMPFRLTVLETHQCLKVDSWCTSNILLIIAGCGIDTMPMIPYSSSFLFIIGRAYCYKGTPLHTDVYLSIACPDPRCWSAWYDSGYDSSSARQALFSRRVLENVVSFSISRLFFTPSAWLLLISCSSRHW